MTLNDYQREVRRTAAGLDNRRLAIAVFGLGIAGESGEVADLVKKWLGQGHTLSVDALEEELGDVLWYVAALAEAVGLSLDGVAAANIVKLRTRYPTGFTTADSLARRDVPTESPRVEAGAASVPQSTDNGTGQG